MYKARELSAKDVPVINSWRQKEELSSHLGAPFRFINLAVDEAWYQNYLNNRHNTVRIVVVDEEDVPLAMGALTNIDYVNRKAETHIMIGDQKQRGKGIGAYIGMRLIKHAFMDLNLNRLEAVVLSDNKEALSMNTKGGFVQEGILRQAVFKNGEYVDLIQLGMLKNETGVAMRLAEKLERKQLREFKRKQEETQAL